MKARLLTTILIAVSILRPVCALAEETNAAVAVIKTETKTNNMGLALFCIAAAAGATVGVVWIYSRCAEKFYCGQALNESGKPDGVHYCFALKCRRDAETEGVHVDSGPYRDAMLCGSACALSNAPSAALFERKLTIERCTNWPARTWEPVYQGLGDPFCFDLQLTNQPLSGAWYRAVYQP